MSKEGKVLGVVKFSPGENMQRSFNFGMLGQQNETFIITPDEDEWSIFNGGFGKFFIKSRTSMRADGRQFVVNLRRYTDETRTKRYSRTGRNRETVNTFTLDDDDDNIMTVRERIRWEDTGEITEGWSYVMHREGTGRAANRK
jgi:hypothetical protein